MEPNVPYQTGNSNPPETDWAQPPVVFVPAPVRATSGLATASLVLALVGLLGGWCVLGLPSFVAVFLGHLAVKETRTGQRGGHGMAVAGLILGYPFAILWAVFGVSGILGSITPFS